MTDENDKIAHIEKFLSTRRRIGEIERKALAKNLSKAPSSNQCSFCGSAEEEVKFLIHGDREACICSECIVQIQGLLNVE